MPRESVSTSSSSKLSQFGLYRTIDARTEEFLKLSKRRQIRQGCACAVISTIITVAVVIVILLVYEYAIAVGTNIVQNIGRFAKITNNTNTNDTPIADRLDRGFLGFDQDYFEQMPLLVNAMQENSYIDPVIEMIIPQSKRGKKLLIPKLTTTSPIPITTYRTHGIRRTSPRPFIFEYRSPTPAPFHKNLNSRSWVDSYRNAQRMKNLEQVIKYLEKTINAKFGDLYSAPSAHIAFSGVYVEPVEQNSITDKSTAKPDQFSSSSSHIQTIAKPKHQSDPYFNFKPDNPGDVNLLADGPFKFSPVPTPSLVGSPSSKIPMFRPISRQKCVGIRCSDNSSEKKILGLMHGSAEINSAEKIIPDKPKSFSVLLNLFPVSTPTPSLYYKRQDVSAEKIYITTKRPQFQLRRKSISSPNRRTYMIHKKRPRLLPVRKTSNSGFENHSRENLFDKNSGAKVILHVNLYPTSKKMASSTEQTEELQSSTTTSTTTTSTTTMQPIVTTPTRPYVPVPSCPPLCATQVEDYHLGSSGIIPIELRTQPITTTPNPQVTTTSFIEDSSPTTEELKPWKTPARDDNQSWKTPAPEIFKFSQEDAKVPDDYKVPTSTSAEHIAATRRNSGSLEDNGRTYATTPLVVRLKQYLETTTETSIEEVTVEETETPPSTTEPTTTEESKETTTVQTYVPQINGHYRSVNQNSKQINNWLSENSTNNRKRKLEIVSVTANRRSLPYVEIRRHSSQSNLRNKDNIE